MYAYANGTSTVGLSQKAPYVFFLSQTVGTLSSFIRFNIFLACEYSLPTAMLGLYLAFLTSVNYI